MQNVRINKCSFFVEGRGANMKMLSGSRQFNYNLKLLRKRGTYTNALAKGEKYPNEILLHGIFVLLALNEVGKIRCAINK